MIVIGLANSESPLCKNESISQGFFEISKKLKKKVLFLAGKWINSNYKGFLKRNHQMFEKIDVTHEDGLPGGGGEYPVQTGFGWSNGVILELLDR